MNEVVQDNNKEEQNWAMYCHLSALVGFVIPLGSIIGPLVVWLLKKDTMPQVDIHGKESLNFQITVLLAFIASLILSVILIGFLLMPIIWLGALILTIMAAVKVSGGDLGYRYPVALRLIK